MDGRDSTREPCSLSLVVIPNRQYVQVCADVRATLHGRRLESGNVGEPTLVVRTSSHMLGVR